MKNSFNILLMLLAMGASGGGLLSDEEPSVEALMANDGIEVQTLDDIPANKIKDVPAEVIREVPAEVIRALPVERLREIPVEVLKRVPVEVLAAVPVEVLKNVPVEILASVPVETLKRVPVEVLASVPVETLRAVSAEVLTSVPVETLRRVPAEVLAAIPVEILRSVPAAVLNSIPVEAIREVAAKHLPDSQEMAQLVAFYSSLNKIFADSDNIRWHRMSEQVKSDLAAWAEIYKAYAADTPAPGKKIELAKGLRMISYMCLPQSDAAQRTLEANLAYYKSEGYNAVLFLVEDLDHLDETLALIRAVKSGYGLAVWATYGGDTSLGECDPVTFLNPAKYQAWLTAIAPEIDG